MLWREWLTRFTKPLSKTLVPQDKTGDFSRWLENLPFANQEMTSDRVLNLIHSLGESTLPVREKLLRLGLIHPVVIKISNLLCQRLSSDAAAVQRAIKLHTAMAESLTILATREQTLLAREELALCIYRALSQYEQLNARHYQIYYPIPSGVWQSIYALYKMANEYDLMAIPMAKYASEKQSKATIGHQIVRIFLLALANPYNLSATEIELLLNTLHTWEGKALLIHDDLNQCHYLYSLQSDSAPLFREFVPVEEVDDSYNGLDVSTLIMSLETLLHNRERGGPAINLSEYSERLVRHLHDSWNGIKQRRHPRMIQQGKIRVLVGLAGTSAFLREQYGFLPDGAAFEAKAIMGQNHPLETGELRLADLDGAVADDIPVKKTTKKTAPAFNPSVHYSSQDWELMNLSDNGMCICALPDLGQDVSVGQIIGVQKIEDAQEPTWRIGIVRWVKMDGDKRSIGMQLIASDGFPILIQNSHQQETGHCLAGILSVMPEEPWQSSMLIAPQLPYQEDDIVFLHGQHYGMQVRLLTCLEGSRYYKLFNYEVIEHIYQ